MAVKVYLGGAPAPHSEMTYDEADTFSVTAGGFLLIQRQHTGAQMDLAVFAPDVAASAFKMAACGLLGPTITMVSIPSRCVAEVVRDPAPGSR